MAMYKIRTLVADFRSKAKKNANNQMPKIIKFLIFVVSFAALWADVAFIVWGTQFNFVIVVPATLSAAYLSYAAARWTILKLPQK